MASSILKFNKNTKITGINVIDGMLFYTDGKTEPKKIELDIFRNADHSSGNTSVYGRPFQERDITVIRPAPTQGINIGLGSSTDLELAAEAIFVFTKEVQNVYQTTARLQGYKLSNSAANQSKDAGFYYIKSEYLPTIEEITDITGNAKKVSIGDVAGGFFNANITGLDSGERYFYVAYAYNNVGEERLAKDILYFETVVAQASITLPTVNTLGLSGKKTATFTLNGEITDNGGDTITERGFYIRFVNAVKTKPSNLYTAPGVGEEKSSIAPGVYNKETGKYQFLLKTGAQLENVGSAGISSTGEIIPTDLEYLEENQPTELAPLNDSFGKNFWYQFYATNSKGTAYGDVKPDDLSETDVLVTGLPQIEYVSGGVYSTSNDISSPENEAKVTARLWDQSGKVTEMGVYFTKDYETVKDILAKGDIDPSDAAFDNVYKVKRLNWNSDNWDKEFTVNTEGLDSEFTILEGDSVFVLPYAKAASGTGYAASSTDSTKATRLKAPLYSTFTEGFPVTTVSAVVDEDDHLDIAVMVGDYVPAVQGRPSIPPPQVSGEPLSKISSIGAYIVQADINTFENLGDVSYQQNEFLTRYNNNTATRIIFKDSAGKNIVSTGEVHEQVFEGDAIVPLETGKNYYVMGFAIDSNGELGLGRLIPVNLVDGNAIPQVGQVHSNSPISTTSNDVELVGSVVNFPLNQSNSIADIGFAYQETSAGDFVFDDATQISFGTLNGATITEGSIANLNSYINNTSTGNNIFGMSIPYSTFSGSEGEVFSYQPFVQMTGGDIIPVTYAQGGDVIKEFTPAENVTVSKVPSIYLSAERQSSTHYGAGVTAYVTDTGHDQYSFNALENKIYFRKADDVSATTFPANVQEVISEATTAGDVVTDMDFGDINSSGDIVSFYSIFFGKALSNSNTNWPSLDPDTKYFVVATSKNNSTATDPYVSGQGAGVGVSNLDYFNTKKLPDPPIFTLEEPVEEDDDLYASKIKIKASMDAVHKRVLSTAGDTSTGTAKIYYIKTSESASDDPVVLKTDPDVVSQSIINSGNSDNAYCRGALCNTQNLQNELENRDGNVFLWELYQYQLGQLAPIEPNVEYKVFLEVNIETHGLVYSNVQTFKATNHDASYTQTPLISLASNVSGVSSPIINVRRGSGFDTCPGTHSMFINTRDNLGSVKLDLSNSYLEVDYRFGFNTNNFRIEKIKQGETLAKVDWYGKFKNLSFEIIPSTKSDHDYEIVFNWDYQNSKVGTAAYGSLTHKANLYLVVGDNAEYTKIIPFAFKNAWVLTQGIGGLYSGC